MTDERSGAWQARQLLIELGVPPGSILMVRGRNTSEEISSFAELLRERSWQRVGLLTSAWHMRRAMRLAQRASFSPAAVPADFRGGAPLSWRRANLPELLPSEESLWRVRLVFWEWLGMLVGR